MTEYTELIRKYNRNHGPDGRFTSAGFGGGGGTALRGGGKDQDEMKSVMSGKIKTTPAKDRAQAMRFADNVAGENGYQRKEGEGSVYAAKPTSGKPNPFEIRVSEQKLKDGRTSVRANVITTREVHMTEAKMLGDNNAAYGKHLKAAKTAARAITRTYIKY